MFQQDCVLRGNDFSPFFYRLKAALQANGLNQAHILKFKPGLFWSPFFGKIHFSIQGLPFQDKLHQPNECGWDFQMFRLHCPLNTIFIAMDGSKNKERATIGIFNEDLDIQEVFRVWMGHSISSIEGLAIARALERDLPIGSHVLIMSDSRSCLEMCKKCCQVQSSNSLVFHILEAALCQLQAGVLDITFIWVPGHKGIKLNEEADKLCCEQRDFIEEYPFLVMEDVAKHISNIAKAKFFKTCNHYLKANGLEFVNSNTLKCDFSKMNRFKETRIHQVRTNNFPTKEWLFNRRLADSPLCAVCFVIDDVFHRLSSCKCYNRQRKAAFQVAKELEICSEISDLSEILKCENQYEIHILDAFLNA